MPLASTTSSVKLPEAVKSERVLPAIMADETFTCPISVIVVVTSNVSVTAKMLTEAMIKIARVAIIVFFMLCSLRRVAPVQDLVSCAFS